jgi:hypothetical protein
MEYQALLSAAALLGGVVALLTHFFWIAGVIRGTMTLNLATWILWSIFDTALAVTSVASEAPAPFMAIGFSLGALMITAVLLIKGSWHWGKLETVCSCIAAVCFLVWYMAGPLAALVALTLGKYLGAAVPTLVQAYRRPEPNQSILWWLGTFSALTNIFGGGSFSIAQSLLPSFAFVTSAVIGALHFRGSFKRPRA